MKRFSLQVAWVLFRMPRVYKRKTSRATTYTEESLRQAIEAVESKQLGVRAASRDYGIPLRTLVRRIQANNSVIGPLGPHSHLGTDAETKLVDHIKKLQQRGFAPSRRDVQEMAFCLAEKLGVKHRFNTELERAGTHWFLSFMKRHKDLSIRMAEGVSVYRAKGMNREDVGNYLKQLEKLLTEYNLFNKPGHLFNMDESGLQLNNKPGKVVAAKGTRDVHLVTAAEKGQTITVVACCNAEGNFLPPYCIFKGTYKKPEFEDGMPPGSKVVMSPKSAYINSELFFNWLSTHFLPRKPSGKVLILLDGHTSHLSDPEILDFALQNDIELLCLPSHCTHYLQPLDRSFFKSLKVFFYQAANNWMKNKDRATISRLTFGRLLNESWIQSATMKNGVSGFNATGIYPFCPSAIPEHAFALSDQIPLLSGNSNQDKEIPTSTPSSSMQETPATPTSIAVDLSPPRENIAASSGTQEGSKETFTPTKILNQISPIPNLPEKRRQRAKQSASHITAKDYISSKMEKLEKIYFDR